MLVTIKRMGINGEGIGFLDKVPVFVDGALLDEVVDVKITESNAKYKKAEIKKIIEESVDRIKPSCRYFNECGGCSLLHTTYENQLYIKKSLIEEAFLKYADYDMDIDVVPSDLTDHYRNSLKLPFFYKNGQLTTGLYKEESNHYVAVDYCQNHEQILEDTKKQILKLCNKYRMKAFDKKLKKGLRYLYLRHIDGKIQLCLVTGNDVLPKSFIEDIAKNDKIVSFYQNINTSRSSLNIFSNKMIHIAGAKRLGFKIDKTRLELSTRSFFQLNTLQAKKLYSYVMSLIDDGQNLICEAYCGVGAMSMLASSKAIEVVGIEIVEDAVNSAIKVAGMNKLDNVKFVVGDAATQANTLLKKRTIDTLIVDPPRSGLDENMIDFIMRSKINNIIYISCNPATLAKNLKEMMGKYEIKDVIGFDMFPNTPHCETIALLVRK